MILPFLSKLKRHPISSVASFVVTVNKLFEILPVRRGEFLRTIKKQYQKMIKVLQSYAIIAVGVRIVVTNSGKVNQRKLL